MSARVPRQVTVERERRAWDLRCACWSQARIAAELAVDQSTVSRALARVEKRVLKELQEEVARQKATRSAQLDHILDEAVQAWERSKESAKQMTKKVESPLVPGEGGAARAVAHGATETVTQQARDQDGDVRYLAEARAAIGDLRKLWGLDAPTKQALTDPSGEREAGLAGPGFIDRPEVQEMLRAVARWKPGDPPPGEEQTTGQQGGHTP